jgi:hypothetical protein
MYSLEKDWTLWGWVGGGTGRPVYVGENVAVPRILDILFPRPAPIRKVDIAFLQYLCTDTGFRFVVGDIGYLKIVAGVNEPCLISVDACTMREPRLCKASVDIAQARRENVSVIKSQ